jgi:hypothetical protein
MRCLGRNMQEVLPSFIMTRLLSLPKCCEMLPQTTHEYGVCPYSLIRADACVRCRASR